MKVKYLEQRARANGQTIWAVNPPRNVRDALNVGYAQYESKSEATKGAIEIADAYDDYRRGILRQVRAAENTVAGLVAFYKSTNQYKKLTVNSRKFYDLMINTALSSRIGGSGVNFGNMQAKSVSPTHADKLYTLLTDLKSEHRAVHVCKVLRKIWYVGKRHGKIQSNPFERMGLSGLQDRTVLWTPEQVDTFVQKADEMGLASIGTLAMLCYDLCQRPGDMRQLTWAGYDGVSMRFTQEKTDTVMTIPVSPRLMGRLDTIKPDNETSSAHIVIYEGTGRPYDRRLYTRYAAKVRNAAGLPSTLQIRDLRRTGATEMAEAGCTEDELRSVTGHKSRDVLSIYVRPTNKLAASGVSKRFNMSTKVRKD
jgi:integrase